MRQRTRVRRIAHNLMGGFAGKVMFWQLKRGLRDEALAKQMGVTVEYLHRMRNGTQVPTDSTLRKLAKVLKVTVVELVK